LGPTHKTAEVRYSLTRMSDCCAHAVGRPHMSRPDMSARRRALLLGPCRHVIHAEAPHPCGGVAPTCWRWRAPVPRCARGGHTHVYVLRLIYPVPYVVVYLFIKVMFFLQILFIMLNLTKKSGQGIHQGAPLYMDPAVLWCRGGKPGAYTWGSGEIPPSYPHPCDGTEVGSPA